MSNIHKKQIFATNAKKRKIRQLLQMVEVTPAEKNKMIRALDAMTETRADQAIQNLIRAVEQQQKAKQIFPASDPTPDELIYDETEEAC